jgi:hypothetical protein
MIVMGHKKKLLIILKNKELIISSVKENRILVNCIDLFAL